jgi:putative phage-type endonuclease
VNRDEWKALRKNYIGGSDAATVVGLNPFASPFSLWAEKTGNAPEFNGNLATEVGSYLEEFVARKFSDVTGKTVRRCNMSLVNDDYPFAIANVDRLIVGEDAGLEIKTTSELNMSKFKGGDYPGNYYAQCVHYLAVTGKARWYLAVLIGNRDFMTFTIERDEDEIAALMDAERAFWNDYVLTGQTPPTDGHSATSSAIRQMWPEDDGDAADLTECAEALEQRKALNEQIKALKTEVDALDNSIKTVMGDAAKGSCGRFTVSWKLQNTSALDREKIKADYPDIDFSKYTSQSRVYRVTEKKEKTA